MAKFMKVLWWLSLEKQGLWFFPIWGFILLWSSGVNYWKWTILDYKESLKLYCHIYPILNDKFFYIHVEFFIGETQNLIQLTICNNFLDNHNITSKFDIKLCTDKFIHTLIFGWDWVPLGHTCVSPWTSPSQAGSQL